MEEKERYELIGYCSYRDTETGVIGDNFVELLNQQDKRIKELQQQLADNNEFFNAFNCKNFNEFKDFISTFMLTPHEEQILIRELKQQLAEKDELLKQKIGDMKSIDFIKMCISCGFMVEAKENDNQTAIEELIKVQKYISDNAVYLEEESFGREINDYIDNQINELKGENK